LVILQEEISSIKEPSKNVSNGTEDSFSKKIEKIKNKILEWI
jgi:hypothetical protein